MSDPVEGPVAPPAPPAPPAKPVVATLPAEVPLIAKLEKAVASMLIRELGNNAMMHNLLGKIVDALKSVK